MIVKMKRISIILALSAAVFASCNKALEKDEVEAGFAPAQPVPTVSNLTIVEVKEVEMKAVVSATFEGVNDGLDSLEIGFLSSTDATFQSASAVLVDPANGTVTATVDVVPGTKNYFRAMAATTGGSAYTEVIEYDVPDIPMYAKLAESYAGTYYSWYTEPKANAIHVAVSEDKTQVTLYNWDPFIANYAPLDPAANALTGALDQENYTITFTADNPPFFMLGFSDAAVVVFDATGENPVSEFVVTVSPDCKSITIPEYGCYSTQQGGFYEGWGGNADDASGPIVLRAN